MATINYSQLTPEQALKMYEDYVTSDQNNEYKALKMLFDYLTSYQQRIRKPNYWDTTDTSVAGNIQYLYKLMIAYIELRLEEGLNGTDEQNQLKEVFKSYRQMTQNQHPEAFIDVLEEYRDKVEKIFETKVQSYSLEELQKLPFVGQLSYEETAEDLLFISFDPDVKNQKDQMKATLRILWEAYRTIMENVKWNEKMEDIYFDTLRKIAHFCLTYKRKGELQWCVDQINRFVSDLNCKEIDLKKNPWHVDLTKPSTNDKHVTIRFELVLTAMEMEMWNEAYKMLETILVLKSMRKGTFRTSYMLQYYEFLTKIFQQSQNTLYQAFAYYNHFLAYKKKPVSTPNEMKAKNDEINKKLNFLVLNILVIPIHNNSEQIHKETVSTLFGKGTKIPNRNEMLQIINEMNVLDFVSPVVRKVFNLVEADQDLLTVSNTAQQCFKELVNENKSYEQFIPLLEENLILKVLKAASIIFKTLKFQSLYKMVSFIPEKKVQQILLYSNVNGTLDCKVDFLGEIIRFNQQTSK